jgi:hypothetical protein
MAKVGLTKKWGALALAAFLILTGLRGLTTLSFTHIETVQAILALLAGIFILIDW